MSTENEKTKKSYWKENKIGTHIMNLIRNSGKRTYDVIKQLEAVCGKSFYNYINNKTEPPISFIIELSTLLDVPIQRLLNLPEIVVVQKPTQEHTIINESINRYALNTDKSQYIMEKLLSWENDLVQGGEKWSLLKEFPTFINCPVSVMKKVEGYVNKKYLKNVGTEVSDDTLINYKKERKDLMKKYFTRSIYTLKSIKRFVYKNKNENKDVTIEEKIAIFDDIIADIERGRHSGMLEIGLINDFKTKIGVGFGILNTIAVIETFEFYYNVTNDPKMVANLRREHEKYWASKHCMKDPDKVIAFFNKQKEIVKKIK